MGKFGERKGLLRGGHRREGEGGEGGRGGGGVKQSTPGSFVALCDR